MNNDGLEENDNSDYLFVRVFETVLHVSGYMEEFSVRSSGMKIDDLQLGGKTYDIK